VARGKYSCEDDVSDLCRNLIFDWQEFKLEQEQNMGGSLISDFFHKLPIGTATLNFAKEGRITVQDLHVPISLPGYPNIAVYQVWVLFIVIAKTVLGRPIEKEIDITGV